MTYMRGGCQADGPARSRNEGRTGRGTPADVETKDRKVGMEKKSKQIIPGIVILAVSIFLAAGVKLIFHACIHEDGSTGSCWWAQQVIFAMAILTAVQSLILIFGKGSGAAAVSLCILFTAVTTALVPGVLIRLCVIPVMHCLAYMKPWTIVCCIVIAGSALTGAWLNYRRGSKDPES